MDEPVDYLRAGVQEPVGGGKGAVGDVSVFGTQCNDQVDQPLVQQLLGCRLGQVNEVALAAAKDGNGLVQLQAGYQV